MKRKAGQKMTNEERNALSTLRKLKEAKKFIRQDFGGKSREEVVKYMIYKIRGMTYEEISEFMIERISARLDGARRSAFPFIDSAMNDIKNMGSKLGLLDKN